jgi:hypothetical protein
MWSSMPEHFGPFVIRHFDFHLIVIGGMTVHQKALRQMTTAAQQQSRQIVIRRIDFRPTVAGSSQLGLFRI